MNDSAKGPGAGYIYQFEIALIELSNLKPNESITIEKIDDIGIEDEKGTYTLTIQAKHSITSTSKTFGNTSSDLWKTLNIWVEKLKCGILNENNSFKAISNTKFPDNAIIRNFNSSSFDENIKAIESILLNQENKRDIKIGKGKSAKSIIQSIEWIKNVLGNKAQLKTIFKNFSFEENYKVEDDFYNKIHLSEIGDLDSKRDIYHRFYGWIIQKSKEHWCQSKDALFTKKDFEEKLHLILKTQPIISGIFRNKKYLTEREKIDLNVNKEDIYIKQLSDINRNREAKEDIIKDAIMDFILCDVEITHNIIHNKLLTKNDFIEFEEKCYNKWKEVRRRHVIKEIEEYSNEELNEIAIKICDEILLEVKLNFQESLPFDYNNKYIQNGTFLNLSNKPIIGWNPDWKNLYKK